MFYNILPKILGPYIYLITGETDMSVQIKRRKWNWRRHRLRKGNDVIEREALDWNPQGKSKRGRSKQMW
jgi:hypothetical protein